MLALFVGYSFAKGRFSNNNNNNNNNNFLFATGYGSRKIRWIKYITYQG
jgi:hypothetical protein